MQVLVTDEGKLKRRVSIEVPLTEVESAYEEVYGQIQKKLKVDGFRPGKFPRELAEKRFKALMQQEAGRNLVPKYLERALKEKNLRPATQPEFHNLEVDRKKPLKFEVAFEVIPDFELLPYSAFQVKLEEARVEPRAVEDRIAEMRNAKATLEDKGDLEAQTGDRVTFDFHATHEGQPVDKIHGHGQKLEVGGGKFLEAFEAQLPGVKAGQEKTFDLVLPENFDEPSLVGKTIQIRMNVSQVEKKVPPPMDESFFSQVSEAKDPQGFTDFVTGQLKEERQAELQRTALGELAEQIRQKYSFEVPQSLVDRHKPEIEHQLKHDDPKLEEDPKALDKKIAGELEKVKSEYRLRYVEDKLSREHDLKPDSQELHQRFAMQAYMMRQNPKDLVNTEYGESMLNRLHEEMLSQKVLSWLMDRIAGKEEPPASDGAKTAEPNK